MHAAKGVKEGVAILLGRRRLLLSIQLSYGELISIAYWSVAYCISAQPTPTGHTRGGWTYIGVRNPILGVAICVISIYVFFFFLAEGSDAVWQKIDELWEKKTFLDVIVLGFFFFLAIINYFTPPLDKDT